MTLIKMTNTIGLFGSNHLAFQVVPAILPGFDLWRPTDDYKEFSREKRIGSKAHVAQSDVIMLSATLPEALLEEINDMAKPGSVFVAVVGSLNERTLQFLRKKCRHTWFAVQYRKPGAFSRNERIAKRQEFREMRHIQQRDLPVVLETWLPLLGATIIARS